jgi:V/A-type H+/Na+-transporting ATPase subunit C
MIRGRSDNLDFLAARLHGRRSRMAEGDRLESLCGARTLAQLSSAVLAGVEVESAAELQRRLREGLAGEVAAIAARLSSAGAELIRWLAVRLQVENLKVVLRGLVTNRPPETQLPHLLALPRKYAIDAETIKAVKSIDDFVSCVPRGPLRRSVAAAIELYGKDNRPFFFESALDRDYFVELLARTGALAGQDNDLVRPLVLQEIDTGHLMLAARGRFGYGLEAKDLLPMHVPGSRIPRDRFAGMLADPDLRAAAGRAIGRALDALPGAPEGGNASSSINAADLERLAWNRFLRLANRAFRRSHMGLAAVVAFVELRRVEVANLITLSEAIRAELPEGQIRARLGPQRTPEAAHV